MIEQLPADAPVLASQLDALQVLPTLDQVHEKFQAPGALFNLEDCAGKDIALILDVPVGTAKARIARGIAQLREIILPDTKVPPPGPGERDSSPTLVLEPLHQF